MTYAVDLSNLALEANGAAASITANSTAISSISVGNSTVNTVITTSIQYSNSTAYSNVGVFGLIASGGSINLGNTSTNTVINSTAITIGSNVATFGTTLYSVANGNIGIGNNTPGSPLVVNGAIITGNTQLGNNQVATVAFAIAAAIAF